MLSLLDVGVDEKRVRLGVDIFHHDLETIEAASFWDLDFAREALDQVLVDDTIRCGEESKDVRDEITLIIVEAVVPVVDILRKVDLFGGPERSLSLLVHLPNLRTVSAKPLCARRVDTYLVIFDGEKNEAVGVLLEDGLIGFLLLDGRTDSALLQLGHVFDRLLLHGLLEVVDD